MKKFATFCLFATLGVVWLGTQSNAQDAPTPPTLETTEQKASYAVGYRIGGNLKQSFGESVDVELLAKGIRDAIGGKDAALDEQAMNEAIGALQKAAQERMQAQAAVAAEENLKKGKAFLAENAKKEGIQVTESGLQYQVIKAGEGASPTPQDKVKVHYHGTLIDGTVFDSSVDRGQPIEFPVTGVIKGWVEGLQLMKVGAKWKLFIPSDLAYGPNPRPGGPIGPNATLVFEVELIEIK